MKSKYDVLVSVLDSLNKEAGSAYKTYHKTDPDGKNYARSLALIHLYLKSRFGLTLFSDRVKQITDGGGDGGIDAYYIDKSTKLIYVIQSKFRTTESNYEEKTISPDEIAAIELNRIAKGQLADASGQPYNGKIRAFQKELSQLGNIGMYDYRVVIIANVPNLKDKTLKKLLDEYTYEILNFNAIYKKILFPICSGVFFDPTQINLDIIIDGTNRAESTHVINLKKKQYSVRLLFVPALEIGRHVSKYKNSLLLYNPRNFLSFKTNEVNSSIRDTILEEDTNRFALLNNGITFVAESDSYTDKIGIANKSKLSIKGPQIINGGQTAFALAQIYDEPSNRSRLESKTVLVKIITPAEAASFDTDLIETISFANNRQTKIIEADQRSNHDLLIKLQQYLYNNLGLFFERKTGEFYEGIESKYIPRESVVKRVEFVKAALAFSGEIAKTRTSQNTIFKIESFAQGETYANVDAMALAYLLRKSMLDETWIEKNQVYSMLGAFGHSVDRTRLNGGNIQNIAEQLVHFKSKWASFIQWAAKRPTNAQYVSNRGLTDNYFKGSTIDQDVKEYFSRHPIKIRY